MVVKNNDGERNECVSAWLKKELKKMNSTSILYSVK
ncbi:unnamed protein product [Brassica rapa subsp. trilocularis]